MQTDALLRRFFFLSIVMMAFGYGVGATVYDLYPVPLIRDAKAAARQLLEESGTVLPWYYRETDRTARIGRHDPSVTMPGLRLINSLGSDQKPLVTVIDVTGKVIHEWLIDWFAMWPSPLHVEEEFLPKTAAAGYVHGVALAADADLILNFEDLGAVRLDACGRVRWRLPYRTHHTVHMDESGHIWLPGKITRRAGSATRPNHEPPWNEFTVLEVSSDGRVLHQWNVADLLIENGLQGLLYLSTTKNRDTRVAGDMLHLNDVETFPRSMAAGAFSPGDLMISLRNISSIFVFDPNSRRLKFQSMGAVLRQHDPDFVDGNTISVFDNNNLGAWEPNEAYPRVNGHYSRLVSISAADGRVEAAYTGSDADPFFTDIMGAHQRLPNGNTLITESIPGRVFEIDRSGTVVWEYFNIVSEGLTAFVPDALWLPPEFDEAFFDRATSTCGSAQ